MVLQRWQTVYLLISVIAMALAAAFPAVEPLRVAQPVVELGGAVLVARVLAAAIAVFLLVTITKFKNLKMQQMLCSVGVDRKSTRLNSSHMSESRMPSSA